GLDQSEPVVVLAELAASAAGVDWDTLADAGIEEGDLETQPAAGAGWSDLTPAAAQAKSYAVWAKDLGDALFRTRVLTVRRSVELGLVSRPDESERDFRIRLADQGRQERDRQIDALRAKLGPKVAALQERIRLATAAV